MDRKFNTDVNHYDGKYEVIFYKSNPKKGRIIWCLFTLFICCAIYKGFNCDLYQILVVLVAMSAISAALRASYESIIIEANQLIEKCVTEINALENDKAHLDTWAFDPTKINARREPKYLIHICRVTDGFPAESVFGTNNYADAYRFLRKLKKYPNKYEIRKFMHTVSQDECDAEKYTIEHGV